MFEAKGSFDCTCGEEIEVVVHYVAHAGMRVTHTSPEEPAFLEVVGGCITQRTCTCTLDSAWLEGEMRCIVEEHEAELYM